MSGSLILNLKGVVKAYRAPGGEPLEVLRGLDLAVRRGETVAVAGPSGSGKSTLLNIIGTLDTADGGSVLFDGRDLSALGGDELARLRRLEIGFVFQRHHLLPHLTALENVLVPTVLSPMPERFERARLLLHRVGLGHRLDHRPAQLSVGECQRAAVVRALVNGPKLLLADEPTGSLDRAGAEDLGVLLTELNRQEGATLVMVTHSQALARKAERILELRGGLLEERQDR